VDPRILPSDDPRTYSLSYDNVMPGFEEILYHEYDSKAYLDDLREKGYPESLCKHEAIHKPNVPPEGPGDHLPLWYPAHYTEEDSECRFIANAAIEYVQKRQDQGWFLSLNLIKPHPPQICPAPYHEMYDPSDMPDPARELEELESDHPYLSQIHRSPDLESERDLQETQANYYGMITEVDTSLGLLFQALKDSGQWDRTMIVFSSDHGEYLGDHYLTGKGKFYDGAMWVPLIVRDPSPEADATRGQQLDGFVESIDHAPTMLEFLGISIPDRFQGQSVLGRVRGEGGGKDAIFYERDIRDEVRDFLEDSDLGLVWVVRDEDFKYIHFADERMPALLFDLKADPREQRNLTDDPGYGEMVLRYCQKLLTWRMKHEDQRMAHWADQHR
jgi:arylsulfatase A-like enzyme